MVEFFPFADHQHYKHETLLPLAELAFKEKAYLVTTRKDYVRVPRAYKDKVVIVDISLVFEQHDLFEAQIDYIAGLK